MRMSTRPPPQPLTVWQISGYDPILFSVQVVERVPITDKRVTIALANQVAVPASQARRQELHGASRAALLRGGDGGGGRGAGGQAALPCSAQAPTWACWNQLPENGRRK